jgi:hypothetical protein
MIKIKLGFNRGIIAEFQIIKYLNFDFIYPTGNLVGCSLFICSLIRINHSGSQDSKLNRSVGCVL